VDWIHLALVRVPVAGCCEHGNEPSRFIKRWEFLMWLSNCWLLNMDSDLWNQLIVDKILLCVHLPQTLVCLLWDPMGLLRSVLCPPLFRCLTNLQFIKLTLRGVTAVKKRTHAYPFAVSGLQFSLLQENSEPITDTFANRGLPCGHIPRGSNETKEQPKLPPNSGLSTAEILRLLDLADWGLL
jgi:hypothetical protein